jgi:hypothetical protein
MNDGVALLVHSCDRYELLYKGFAHFFHQSWDEQIPVQKYFATEEKEAEVEGFQNILSGKGEWSDRLAFLLREKIPEQYILYFQEDMWLNKKAEASFFIELFELVKKKNWQQVKLHSSEVYRTKPTEHFIQGFNIAEVDKKNSQFLMSHQVTLWNKTFLLQQLPKNEHPWRNERKGSKRLKKLNSSIWHIDYFAENGQNAINNNHGAVHRSEYRTVSFNGMLNHNVVPFIQELRTASSDIKQYAAVLEDHYQRGITHDGQKRPKKTDPVKQLKNWLQNATNKQTKKNDAA